MNFEIFVKFYLLIVIEAILFCLASGIHMIVKQDREGEICFTLKNSTERKLHSNETSKPPKVSLDLLVRYPQSIAEAGYVDLEEELTPGPHKVWYKYRVTDMTHDVEVKLDGVNIEFIKPKIPRWYTVSLFHEVTIVFQGNIVENKCSYNESKKTDDFLPFTFGLKVFTSTTKGSLIEHEEIRKISFHSPTTASKPENLERENKTISSSHKIPLPENASDHVTKTINESFPNIKRKETNKLPLTTVSTLINKTVEKEHASKPSEQETNQINISIEIPNATLDRQENLSQAIFPNLNYSDFENSRPESSQSCPNGDCEGQYSHNYTLAFWLIGILGAMVLIAIVISVVFHRKKKKLMISNRARPNNRLRQQIFETEIAQENLQMLKQMEHTYEELP